MKLRNKKTWEIAEGYVTVGIQNNEKFPNPIEFHTYKSLTELNEEWEDYKPDEALIKDERIRKAVRAWAEVNGYTKLWVYHDYTTISFYNEDDGDNEITFNTMEKFGLEQLKCYAITELCG